MASLSFLVLPFVNPSGDPDQNYVAVNVTSDLTARLSGLADSVVIARSSALTIASQSLPLPAIGRLFGVRYVLRGEAFTEGTHVHVTATLVRAENEEPLWSERFEREFATLWNLEQEIITRIAQRLDVTHADVGPHSPPELAQDAAALDSLLRANAVANEPTTAQTIAEARRLFTLALSSPARAVEAKAGLAAVHLLTALSSRVGSASDLSQCDRLVHEALAADPRNARALNTLGALRRATGKPREALGAYEAAIAVDRNDASAHAQIGRLKVDMGEPAQALPHIELALRLSPLDPQRPLWFTFAGLALLHIGDPAAARSWLEKSVAVAPQFVTSLVFLAAAQQLEGHSEDARRTIAAVQRLNPTLSVARVEQQFAPAERGGAGWSRIRESLHQAGLPN